MPNELHTMPLKCEAIMSSNAWIEMTNEEFGAYMKLLIYSWLNEGWFFAIDLRIAKVCGVTTEDEIDKIKKIIERWFPLKGEGEKRANQTLLETYEKTLQKSNRRSLAGKKGNDARWNDGAFCDSVCDTNCDSVCDNKSIASKTKTKVKGIKEKIQKKKYGEGGHVFLTEDEHSRLVSALGEEMAMKCVFKLDAYKGSTGKRYKSDYATIHSWVIRSVVEESSKTIQAQPGDKLAIGQKHFEADLPNWRTV